mmetsp:Transcript_6565/g.16604  ORF Transcript_6565/g.16604 Transcript_6565/m.16604 type:complete len:121 (+) Transcript_6565:1807-2169(+)
MIDLNETEIPNDETAAIIPGAHNGVVSMRGIECSLLGSSFDVLFTCCVEFCCLVCLQSGNHMKQQYNTKGSSHSTVFSSHHLSPVFTTARIVDDCQILIFENQIPIRGCSCNNSRIPQKQ